MQNQYYQYFPQMNPQILNNYIDEQNKNTFKRTCSSAGFIVFWVFITMQFIAIPFQLFLIPAKDGVGVQGIDYNSYYLFYSFMSFLSFFVTGLIFIKIHKLNLNELFSFKKTPAKDFIPLMVIGYGVFTAANYAVDILNNNFSFWGINDNSSAYSSSAGPSPINQILFFISLAIVPAITEEFVFRGIIIGLLRKYGDGFAIIASAILFGLLHGNLTQIPFAFIGGIFLGYLRIYTDSMLPSMFMHLINNGVAGIFEIAFVYFPRNIVNIVFTVFLTIVLICSVISIIFLAAKNKKLFSLNSDSITKFSISQKIKMFLCTPGVIAVIISSALTTLLFLSLPIPE